MPVLDAGVDGADGVRAGGSTCAPWLDKATGTAK